MHYYYLPLLFQKAEVRSHYRRSTRPIRQRIQYKLGVLAYMVLLLHTLLVNKLFPGALTFRVAL